MKLNRLLYITIASLILAACSDDSPSMTVINTGGLTISYTTDNYGNGLSRAGTESEESRCWSDFNEKSVADLDFYLLDNSGVVTFYRAIPESQNDCNVTHDIITFDPKDPGNTKYDITFNLLSGASKIVMIANIPLSGSERVGKTLAELYSEGLTGLVHDQKQSKFAMYGEIDVPANLSRYRNIVVPLRRIAAKIRVTLQNVDQSFVAGDGFYSMLCRYTTNSRVLPEAVLPSFTGVNVDDTSLPSTTSVAVQNSMIPEGIIPDPEKNEILWEYPEDLTDLHPADMMKDNGHVYYTYPSDWIDYTLVKNQCSRSVAAGTKDNLHAGHAKEGGDRYEIIDYDDKAPIDNRREMFLIIKAQYGGKWWFYKAPVNYRFAAINDYQCFSADDLTGKIFPLYRADRNHFYDIVALIDRPGAGTPEEAMTNPYFTVKIADMEDGGTFDYIYDETNTDHFDLDINQWEDGGETELE